MGISSEWLYVSFCRHKWLRNNAPKRGQLSNLFILGRILKHNLLFCIQFFENAIILVHAGTILGRVVCNVKLCKGVTNGDHVAMGISSEWLYVSFCRHKWLRNNAPKRGQLSNLFILGRILKHNLLFCIQFFENAIILVHAGTILGRQYPRRLGAGLPQPFDTS